MKFAAVDIGSNAVRLLLTRVIEENDEPIFKKEVLVRMPLRLGEDVFRTGVISPEMSERLVNTLRGFTHLIAAYPAVDSAAYATSALREAKNRKDVLARIRRDCDLSVEVIEGRREAEIIYANHIEHRLDPKKNYLYIDVGGGSTEVTVIARGELVANGSFPVGTVRTLHGTVSRKSLDDLKRWVKEHRSEVGRMSAIGSGGNINTMFRMARIEPGKPMSLRRLREMKRLLDSYTLEERIVALGLRPDRADVIAIAAGIYLSVMQWGRIRKMYVPQVGLSDGIVHLLYERHKGARA